MTSMNGKRLRNNMEEILNCEIKLYLKYWKVEIIYKERGVELKKFSSLDDAVAYIKKEVLRVF